MELYKGTLVCEGGAMLGVYTAGVLDVLMKHNIYFDHAIGVSIGSSCVIDYSSMQIGRTIECMALKDRKVAYVGLPSLFKRGQLFDYDLCFEGFGELYVPYDYEAFEKSPIYTEVVVTDVKTGKPAYIHCVAHHHQVMDASRASATLPVVSKPFVVDGIACLDGGIVDPIPLDRAYSYGNNKIVVIMTKVPGFRKHEDDMVVTELLDRNYSKTWPEVRRALAERYIVYNKEADRLDQLEKEGKVFVFRPAVEPCSRIESNYEKLRAGYDMGVQDATERFNELMEYLNKPEL